MLTLLQAKRNPLSIRSAKDIRLRIEALPDVPRWRHQEMVMSGYKSKSPLVLYYRDGLEVAEYLFGNPIFAKSVEMDPYKLFEDSPAGPSRAYGEFMSGDFAWEYQVGRFHCQLHATMVADESIDPTPTWPFVHWDHRCVR